MEKLPENWGVGEWSTGKNPEDFEKLAEKQPDKEAIEEQNKTIASINKHLGIENKESTEPEKQPEELPEKAEEPQQTPEQQPKKEKTPQTQLIQRPEKSPENTKIKEQLHGLIEKAAVVFYSKEIDPNERIKLMGEYSTQIAKLLNMPPASIYLTELIADSKKQNQLIDKISGLVDKAKEIPKPEVIKKAAEFVKNEEKKGKESIFQKMGGWNTVGGIAGFSLMIFLILIFLGEFKLLEKTTGIEMEGGGKGGKK